MQKLTKTNWGAIALLSTVTVVTSVRAGPVEDAMNADRAFSRMAQEKGVAEAFGFYAAPDALRFVPGTVQRGPAEVQASLAKDFADGGKLEWEPKEGRASRDGAQVTVWGRWTFTGAGDPKTVRHGTYLTVWVRQADGSWRWTHDIGNSDPLPPQQ